MFSLLNYCAEGRDRATGVIWGVIVVLLVLTAGCVNIKADSSDKSFDEIVDKCTKPAVGKFVDINCIVRKIDDPAFCDFLDGKVRYTGPYKTTYFTKNDTEYCRLYLADSAKDESYCSKFSNDFEKTRCFLAVGKFKKDPFFCKNISEEYKSSCYLFLAKKSNSFDLSLCDELSSSNRLLCYSTKAKTSNNATICLKFDGEPQVYGCYSGIFDAKSISRCQIPGCDFDLMLREKKLGKNTINVNLCEFNQVIVIANVSDNDRENGKGQTVQMDEAYYLNESLLNMLDNSRGYFHNEACRIGIGMYEGSFEWCKESSECYLFTALRNNRVGTAECDKEANAHPSCYKGVAIRTRDVSVCLQLPTQDVRDVCALQLALKDRSYGVYGSSDNRYCKYAGSHADECYLEVYKETPEAQWNLSMCDSISRQIEAPNCYYTVAIDTRNVSLCSKTNNPEECSWRIKKMEK